MLLEAVADKTGYPIDMLELDMRLDADLGIDSIKRVEILSAVQEHLPRASSISPEQLGTLASLRQIVDALLGTRSLAQASHAEPQNGRPAGIINTNGTVHPARHASEGGRHGNENETASAASRRQPSVRCIRSFVAWRHADTREQIRLRAGGMVWVTSDGSPLTDAVCAALRKRELHFQVIRLEESAALVPDERLCGLIMLAPEAPSDDAFVKARVSDNSTRRDPLSKSPPHEAELPF